MSGSFDMPMVLPRADKTDAYLRHVEALCPFSVGDGALSRSYVPHLVVGGLDGVSASALRDHVGHIILPRPNKQMIGIDARRIIAFMENAQAVWDRSFMKNPGSAVHQNGSLTEEGVSSRDSSMTKIGYLAFNVLPTSGWSLYCIVGNAIRKATFGWHLLFSVVGTGVNYRRVEDFASR